MGKTIAAYAVPHGNNGWTITFSESRAYALAREHNEPTVYVRYLASRKDADGCDYPTWVTLATPVRVTLASGKRELNVRPWSVRPGDVVEVYTDLTAWQHATVTNVVKTRAQPSGSRVWDIHTDLEYAPGRFARLTVYRDEIGGAPTKVTVWRE